MRHMTPPVVRWTGLFAAPAAIVVAGVAVAVAWGRNQYNAPGPSAVAQCV